MPHAPLAVRLAYHDDLNAMRLAQVAQADPEDAGHPERGSHPSARVPLKGEGRSCASLVPRTPFANTTEPYSRRSPTHEG
jgi:hypothetical protein